MATIQIRDIPEEEYETIRRRARAAGMSLQAYMREQVVELARRRTKSEAWDAMETAMATSGGRGATLESIVDDLDADRR